MKCSVDGCEGTNITARGMCRFHYRAFIAGKPLVAKPPDKNVAQWLLAHVEHPDKEACLIWPFARDQKHGRGELLFEGKVREAARLMCELSSGKPPSPEMQCAHSCGRGHLGCVNPNHLRWATRVENEADKKLHGTSNAGSRHGMSKLTESQVLAIREFAQILPNRVAGSLFGIERRTADRIVNGETWRHV